MLSTNNLYVVYVNNRKERHNFFTFTEVFDFQRVYLIRPEKVSEKSRMFSIVLSFAFIQKGMMHIVVPDEFLPLSNSFVLATWTKNYGMPLVS